MSVVAGKVVHGADKFASLAPALPPASPSWSPVKTFGGYQSRKVALGDGDQRYHYAAMCACSSSCLVHGHDHAYATSAQAPTSDPKSFWGALGCSCYV